MHKSALAPKQLASMRLLLVEDNASDAFLVESLFSQSTSANYEMEHVKTQWAAINALTERTFDVCLLDLTLPDANGFSALIELQEKAQDMPVLILTGTNDMALAKRAVSRGAQDYLLKGEMDISALSRAIDYAVERKRVEKELFQRANYDALTDLATRNMFINRINMALARAERSGSDIAILFIDLDRFKAVNDNYCHEAGDETLRVVGQRIKAALRAYDTPARFGGDEFAVLLEGISSPRDAAVIAQKIIKTIAMPIPYQHSMIEVGASIGIALSKEPGILKDSFAEMLVQHADIAMYHAKKDGGNIYRFYADSMQDEVRQRMRMEEDLRQALNKKQLRLYYQPHIQLNGQKACEVEALLRWDHPEYGILCAGEFLEAAEAARLMPDIAKFACAQLQRDLIAWNKAELPPVTVSINLSMSQLEAPDMLNWLALVVDKDVIGRHSLMVEIPEQALSPLSGQHYMLLAKLHEMRIGLHLDDFGRGALPLTSLCSLPFSMLKIDRQLFKDVNNQAGNNILISAAILLAHHLGMKACAVGIEEKWQTEVLKKHRCDCMQGFLAAVPMPAEDLVGWMKGQ